MRITFLGSTSQNGGSPTLYATDRNSLVVRGYQITDPQALADLGEVPAGEADIEIPLELLRYYTPPAAHDEATSTPTAEDKAKEGR
ncbi:hypothetical protein [Spongiactinospora gelatinilytica]|uniref:hypothetical protein n=1 Tax=Spongiactinospora gelatinilytica TaxID=2666298 RepID=UPI0018F37377|nr:hypothetical protein [Spongiactinospora gelatinilytica]